MSLDLLPEKVRATAQRLRPLSDRVIVRPLSFKHPTLFVAGIELRKGIVVAVGAGRRIRRKIPWRIPTDAPHSPGESINPGQTFMVEDGYETGKIKPMSVKPGDVVEYGFRDVSAVTIDGEEFVIVRERNIYGTTDARTDRGLLEPASAAID